MPPRSSAVNRHCQVNDRNDIRSLCGIACRGASHPRDGVPGDERPRAEEPLMAGAQHMPSDSEEVVNDPTAAGSMVVNRPGIAGDATRFRSPLRSVYVMLPTQRTSRFPLMPRLVITRSPHLAAATAAASRNEGPSAEFRCGFDSLWVLRLLRGRCPKFRSGKTRGSPCIASTRIS